MKLIYHLLFCNLTFASYARATLKHLPLERGKSYLIPMNPRGGKVLGGQFYWGGTLPKSNARTQRSA